MRSKSARSSTATENRRPVRSPASHRRRNTDTASTSTRSGATRSPPRTRRSRAAPPSAPSSARALATTDASTTINAVHAHRPDPPLPASIPRAHRADGPPGRATPPPMAVPASRVSSPLRYCCSDWPRWVPADATPHGPRLGHCAPTRSACLQNPSGQPSSNRRSHCPQRPHLSAAHVSHVRGPRAKSKRVGCASGRAVSG